MQILQADVLVIGAGLGGICAAVSAARNGCQVILVEKSAVLGGNSGPDAGVHPSGAHRFHTFAAETGIIEEICELAASRNAKTNTDWYHYNISPLWDSVLQEVLQNAGVLVLRNHYARKPVMENSRIAAVIAEDLAAYVTKKIEVSGTVIEASGDGHIAASAGASFRMGREAQSEYGERLAPEKADSITMGSSVVALVRDTGRPVSFTPPPNTPPFRPGYMEKPSFSAGGGTNTLQFFFPAETGGQKNTIADEAEIYQTCVSQVYAAWNHIKNISHKEEAKNFELLWIGPRLCKRESRRFQGDVVLTQNDVESGKIFEDAIAFGGFAEDIHYPRPENEEYVKIVYFGIPPLYTIPYRSIYSKDITNLLFASRLFSVSHIAHGTTRLQRTLAAAGQAAGLAAAFCKAFSCTPKDVYRRHLQPFRQALLRQDGTVPNLFNADEHDLARFAAVSASSERAFAPEDANRFLPLDKAAGAMLWDWPETLSAVSFFLRNDSGKPRKATLSAAIRQFPQKWKTHDRPKNPPFPYESGQNEAEWGYDNRAELFAPLASSSALVPPGAHWVEFPLGLSLPPKDPCSDEERVLLTLAPENFLALGVCPRFYDPVRFVVANGGDFTAEAASPAMRLSPNLPYAEAARITDGMPRRFSYNPVHYWESAAPLPQWVCLSWEAPQKIGFVQVTFDSITRTFHEMPLDCRKNASPRLAKAFILEAFTCGTWQTLAAETENFHRFRTFFFPPLEMSALRLTVSETWGGGPARVYEIRAYGEKPKIG